MQEEKKGTAPAYKGSGVSVWVNKKEDGETYLNVSVLGGKGIACWKYTPKPKKPVCVPVEQVL